MNATTNLAFLVRHPEEPLETFGERGVKGELSPKGKPSPKERKSRLADIIINTTTIPRSNTIQASMKGYVEKVKEIYSTIPWMKRIGKPILVPPWAGAVVDRKIDDLIRDSTLLYRGKAERNWVKTNLHAELFKWLSQDTDPNMSLITALGYVESEARKQINGVTEKIVERALKKAVPYGYHSRVVQDLAEWAKGILRLDFAGACLEMFLRGVLGGRKCPPYFLLLLQIYLEGHLPIYWDGAVLEVA